MELRRLRLRNFRQHRETELRFGPGLTGIIGPNGAGKTTLLEAIAWAIYGNKAARGTRDSLRWRRATPRAEVRVELEFRLGPHEYRVMRTLFSAELYLDGAPAPIATSTQEVTERLTRIVRMTRDEFFKTYFTGQKDLAVMAELGAAERRRFLNRLLDYDRLLLAQRKVRERRGVMVETLESLRAGAPDPRALAEARAARAAEEAEAARRLAEAEEGLEAARAASDQHLPVFRGLKEFRERHQALTADRRVAEEQLRQAVDELRRLEGEHAAAARAREELAALEPSLAAFEAERAALKELDALARDAEARSRMEAQLGEVAAQAEEVRGRLAQAREAAAAAREAAERLDAARGELDAAEALYRERDAAWVRERADAEAVRRSLLEQYHDLETQRDRVVGAGEGGACPTCGRPLGGEYHAVLEMLDTQLGDVKQNGQFYRARIDQLRDVPADVLEADALRHGLEAVVEAAAQDLAVARRAAEEAASLEQQVKALEGRRARLAAEAAALRGGYDRERHDGVRRRVAELEPAVLRAQALRRDAGRADAVGQALRAAEERRAGLVERYAALQRELAGLEYDEASFLAAEERMRELERVWRGAEQAVATARAERTLAAERRGEAEQREQEAAARAARLGVLQADVRLHQELDRALDDLSTDLNAEIGPEISALASEFLATLTDGLYDEVQLDEDFEATVYADGEPVPVLSGGEEDLRNLVLRLAVSQMIADRSGQPLSLLVLDEIFGSLDEARSENVMRLLRGLGARFPQVVLITHVEGVRDSLDRIIRVRYDEASGAAIVSEERVPDRLPGGSGADVAA